MIKLIFDSIVNFLVPVDDRRSTMPEITFELPKKNKRSKNTSVVPNGYVEKLTTSGVILQKTTMTDSGIETDIISTKSGKLQDEELAIIRQKYPSVKTNAVIIAKQCYVNNYKISQTIFELRKHNLEYGETYVKYFRQVFKEFEKQIGEKKEHKPSPTFEWGV